MSKGPLRAEARARLRAISPAERDAAAAAIARRIWTVPEIASARSLLLYASLPEEVPTDEVAREASRRGVAIIYPRCLPEMRAMTLHVLGDVDGLSATGSYGIREPDPSCALVEVRDIDAALVPGLAWDRAGGRLGRGAGYYDRLFADPAWRGFRCGTYFAVQEIPGLPADPWDAPLDAVVTEREVVRVTGT